MSSLSVVQVIGAIWGGVILAYVVLLVYRYTVGLHEDDSLHISAGEARFEAEQREVLKHMDTLDARCHKLGFVALGTTALLVGVWVYSIVRGMAAQAG